MAMKPFREQPWLVALFIGPAVIAGLMAVVGSNVMNKRRQAQIAQTKIQLGMIAKQIDAYKHDCETLPSTEQGLKALVEKPSDLASCKNWHGPYLSQHQLKDEWGTPFAYAKTAETFTLKSFGADKREGGEGSGVDLVCAEE